MSLGAYYLKKDAKHQPEWVKLLIAGYDELLKSDFRKGYECNDADFIDDMWGAKDDDLFAASPSLEKAFLEFVKDKAEGFVSDCSYKYEPVKRARERVMDAVDGRNNIAVCNLDDWYESAIDVLRALAKRKQEVAKA